MIASNIATTGMIVWEAMLEIREADLSLDELWNNVGSFDMRDLAVRLAIWAEEVFAILDEDDFVDGRIAFDFEFVPYIVSLVEWADPLFTPDVNETVLACMNRFKKELGTR